MKLESKALAFKQKFCFVSTEVNTKAVCCGVSFFVSFGSFFSFEEYSQSYTSKLIVRLIGNNQFRTAIKYQIISLKITFSIRKMCIS